MTPGLIGGRDLRMRTDREQGWKTSWKTALATGGHDRRFFSIVSSLRAKPCLGDSSTLEQRDSESVNLGTNPGPPANRCLPQAQDRRAAAERRDFSAIFATSLQSDHRSHRCLALLQLLLCRSCSLRRPSPRRPKRPAGTVVGAPAHLLAVARPSAAGLLAAALPRGDTTLTRARSRPGPRRPEKAGVRAWRTACARTGGA